MAKNNTSLNSNMQNVGFVGSVGGSSILTDGSTTLVEQIAPSSILFTSEDEIKVENNYVKSFVINGYPARVFFGWMDNLYSYDGDMDVAVHIEPCNERSALEELIDKIAQYETQFMIESEKGSIKNLRGLQNKIQILTEQRERLEQNYENMFHVSTFVTMYGSDLKELNKDAQRLQSKLAGTKMNLMPLYLRQDDGYMSCSPYGVITIPEFSRNINTGALGTMFPFYNAELSNVDGTFIGINSFTKTPIFLNLFDTKKYGNANLFISGASGSGKTFLVDLIMSRTALEGDRHCIIDPENEYGICCDVLGGITFKIAPNSELMLNPFDIDEEVEIDKLGNPTGRKFVDIKGKSAELLNLFGVMLPNLMTDEVKAEISEALVSLYYNFGITEDVNSLYVEDTNFNPETGEYYMGNILKIMPTMSDFRNLLIEKVNRGEGGIELRSFVNALKMYVKGGIYDLFDCYTTVNTSNLDTMPIIRFDVSAIEDEILRPIGMYVALSWAWNKFMKKDAKTKKRIVCDEAWMLLAKAMAGSEYTAHFLETCARRVRKYKGSLCCASQNFREFVGREEGQAILSNSAIKIFLRQSPEDIEAVGDRFIMSDGEKDFLLTATRGQLLIKVANESVVGHAYAFPFEKELYAKDIDDDETDYEQ